MITFSSMISGCASEQDPNLIELEKSSDEIVGENYQSVIKEFEELGFTTIETVILDDLITGWLTKDGEIEKVEINGEADFGANESFQKDDKVVITYHTFPEENKDEEEKVTDKEQEETASGEEGSNTEEQSEADVSEEENTILTIENSQDLAALLTVTDPFDSIVSDFANKYSGKTIEFDGNIANMMGHENYETRYDILILNGDYSETTAIGPNFKFEDVSVLDLKLTGEDIPDSITAGQNFKFTAIVDRYDEATGLFFLNPVKTETR